MSQCQFEEEREGKVCVRELESSRNKPKIVDVLDRENERER
jgi:hypothetical protein